MKFAIEVSSSFTAKHWHDKTLNEAAHPHNFRFTVTLSGPLNAEGYIADFREVDQKLKAVSAILEGQILNDIVPVPTAENVAAFIFAEIQKSYPELITKVKLQETADYAATCEI